MLNTWWFREAACRSKTGIIKETKYYLKANRYKYGFCSAGCHFFDTCIRCLYNANAFFRNFLITGVFNFSPGVISR
jgi:hypothetical protein